MRKSRYLYLFFQHPTSHADTAKAPSPPPPKPPPKPPVIKGPEFHTAVLKSKAFKEKERRQREEEAAASRKKERPSSSSAREEQSSRDDDGEISRVSLRSVAKIFIGTFQSFLAPSMTEDTLILDSSLSLFSSSNSTLCFCSL